MIAEMATGEGKTLVATLPCYLNALTGKSVIVVTANEYLAKRDANWMSPIFEGLGMNVGYIIPELNPSEKKKTMQRILCMPLTMSLALITSGIIWFLERMIVFREILILLS